MKEDQAFQEQENEQGVKSILDMLKLRYLRQIQVTNGCWICRFGIQQKDAKATDLDLGAISI